MGITIVLISDKSITKSITFGSAIVLALDKNQSNFPNNHYEHYNQMAGVFYVCWLLSIYVHLKDHLPTSAADMEHNLQLVYLYLGFFTVLYMNIGKTYNDKIAKAKSMSESLQ